MSSIRILFVEDNEDDMLMALERLHEHGFQPAYERVDTKDAFVAALKKPWDCIISDFKMPRFTGEEALDIAKFSGITIPFILVSGTIGEDIAVEVMKKGASDYLLKDKLGRLGAAVSHALDEIRLARERNQARESLKESEERFRTLFENATLGIYRTSPGGEVILANPALVRMLGFDSIDDLKSRNLEEEGYEPSYPRSEFRQRMEREGEIKGMESAWKRKDGSTIHVRESSKVTRGPDGSIVYYEGTVEDITEQKLVTEALHKSEERLSLAVSASGQGLWDWNIPADEAFLSPKYYELTGYKEGETHANAAFFQDIIHPDDRSTVARTMADHFEGKTELSVIEYRMRTKSGEYKWIRGDGKVVVRDKHGSPVRMIGTISDITNRKRAEEELRTSEQKLSNAATIAHLGHWEYDVVNDLFTFNDQFYSMLRTSAHLVGGYTMSSQDYAKRFVNPEDIPLIAAEIKNAIDTTDPHYSTSLEHRIIYADGGAGFITVRILVVKDEHGRTVKTFGVNQDITERKLMEGRILYEQSLLRALLDTMPSHVYFKDRESRFLKISKSQANHFGIDDPVQAVGKRDSDFFSEQHAQSAFEDEQRIMETGIPIVDMEEKETWPGGWESWVSTTKVPLRDAQGRIMGTFGISRDITARKEAEQALVESENRYRLLAESSPEMIFVVDGIGRVSYLNATAAAAFRTNPGDLMGKYLTEIYPPDLAEQNLQMIQAIFDTRRPLHREVFQRFPAGEMWVDTRLSPMIDANDKVVGVMGLSIDITERKHAEESLIRLNKAVEASGEAIFMTDPNGVFTFINSAFTQLYGYVADEVIGKTTPRILKSGKRSAEAYTRFWKTLSSKKIVKGEWVNRAKDGRFLTIEVSVNPILDAHGNILGYLAIQRDVTEHRAMEEHMRQAQKMESIGTLASGIAHDFNNILGIIMGHASLVERFQNDPARLSASLTTIINAAKRGASVVRQMLTFARKSEIEFRPLYINDSVAEIEKFMHATFPKTISLVRKDGKDLPLINADATQVHQVLLNLCVNARDAMQGSGTLTVSTRHLTRENFHGRPERFVHPSYVVVEVSDTGSGMDEETQRRIFEPFFTTKELGSGTGLGLSVVFGIVQSHEGFVDVDSSQGRGTTFSVHFPVKSNSALQTEKGQEEHQEPEGGTETLFLVEDEDLLRDSIRIILSLKGYTVVTAQDGSEAIQTYSQRWKDIALVLCDYGLPKVNGHEVLRQMKRVNPSVKFVLASGFVDPEELSNILRDGAKDIIQKPYIAVELLEKVRQMLDS